MNRFIISILSALCIAFSSLSLSAETHKIYAVIVTDGKTTPVLIQETTDSGGTWSGFNFKGNYLRDSDGKELRFNNFLPALAYMEKLGWTVPDKEEQIYRNIAQTIIGRASFLLCKEVSEEEWLQWIERGKYKK